MVRMNAVWDRTTEVLRGRGSMLASIAGALVFLPAVAQYAFTTFGANRTSGFLALFAVVVLVLMVVRLIGSLAIVAASSDPLHDSGSAIATGARRLPPLIGLTSVIGLAAIVLALPLVAMLGSSVDWAALARGEQASALTAVSGGVIAAVSLYALALFGVAIWATARLFLLVPVVVNERAGFASLARSFALTRGSTWRIIGMLLLFGIVFLVATSAVTLVVTLVFRLILGADHQATAVFLGQVAGAVVAAAYAVVTGAFSAQLYRTLTGREAAETFA